MICATIQNKTFEEILELLEKVEMAEIRLDRCNLDESEIGIIFSEDLPLVATCRISEIGGSLSNLPEESRIIKASQIAEKKLAKAIEAGAKYVDVEIEAPKQMSKRIQKLARENGTVFIRSYHDFEHTDSIEALKAMVEKCRYHGADIVKIVTKALTEEDNAFVLSLYNPELWKGNELAPVQGGLIAFCMGETGRNSRIDCLKFGSPYTYAAADEAAAEGQWPYGQMHEAVYGKRKFIYGQLSMPASKSFAQRAILAAALASGESHLRGYTSCSDTDAALKAAEVLGAEIKVDGSEISITGIGYDGLGKIDISEIEAGESGLLTRLLIPVLSQAAAGEVTITGEKTLSGRPMKGVCEIMDALGAYVKSETDECTVPLKVCGPLGNGRIEISGKNGSQLISGLLMALPFSQKNTTLIVSEPKSIPYMFITVDVLKHFGIKIGSDMSGGADFFESQGDWNLCTEIVFKIRGGQKMKACEMDVEGDWSAAANFLVAGAIFGRCELSGLDTSSLQADLSIMDILMEAGASLSQLDGDKGDVIVQRAPMNAFSFDCSHCPDLFPAISVLASFCEGESHIAGVGRLAHKESNRGKAILEMLEKLGVPSKISGDELIIEGRNLTRRIVSGELLKGGKYSSSHDHRMVMALSIASLGADSEIEIDDKDCVAKSFPCYFDAWKRLM